MTGRGRPSILLTAAVVAGLLGACGSTPVPSVSPATIVETPSPSPSDASTASPSPSPSPTPTPTPTPTPGPTLTPTPVVAIVPCPGAVSRAAATTYPYTATGAAGYAIGRGGAKVSCVEATWTQPKVTCSKKNQLFSISVGLDGWTSTEMHVKAENSVEVGVQAECLGGTLKISGWHRAFPEDYFQDFYGFAPAAGDIVWAQVTFTAGRYTMALRDKTTGAQVSITQVIQHIARVAAVWEVTSVGVDCNPKCTSTTLPKFSPIVFSSVDTTMNGKKVALGGAAIVDVLQGTKKGVKRLVASRIASSGRSFTITWKHA